MTKILLSLHVLVAILAVGPVAVAASMFPPALRRVHAAPGDPAALASLRTLHRVCRVYAGVGIAVPVFGLATASSLGVLGDAWLITSIMLTAAAAAVLAFAVLPRQERLLAAASPADDTTAPHTAAGPAGGTAADGTSAGGNAETPAAANPTGGAPDMLTAAGPAGGTSAALSAGEQTGEQTGERAGARLAMYTGVFNLLWAVVTVLMIVRPGSTTGV
ncbi:hypothetical protein FHS43_003758 [Streptosporangium becharense]|uniref:Uncharacterized protein n=1 Tax=Streptosporangium becharense TaxID=1816182 RepID=A0A7W9IHA5_9ACTN|nr:protease [Streptosporangium becharense]MBB2912475.1 hypothetical protein [Streptosporangium becharense]MBB5820695.1 hypothetical protein [Streptosporangium becharense]